MRARIIHNKGFTLMEVLAASTISAFIALVAVGAMKAVTDSSQVVTRASETAGEVRFAARMMARDLANLYRDPNPQNMKLVGNSEEAEAGGAAILTFYAVGCPKARASQPEGDVYEVEYFLTKNEVSEEAQGPDTFMLLRRLWPNPDEKRDPGGIVTPVAENLVAFEMRFFDGQQWSNAWPKEMQSLPQLIEVTLAAKSKERGGLIVETFTASFPRLPAGAEGPVGPESPGGGEGPQQLPQPQETPGQETPGVQEMPQPVGQE
jgi:general secretion pathway protein J